MDAKAYDLVVIGSGPAGEKGSAQAAYFGKKVALVEKEPVFGGAAAVIGEQASELVHTGLCAMLMGASADLFIQTCFNYPPLSEMFKYATYDALGKKAKATAASSP